MTNKNVLTRSKHTSPKSSACCNLIKHPITHFHDLSIPYPYTLHNSIPPHHHTTTSAAQPRFPTRRSRRIEAIKRSIEFLMPGSIKPVLHALLECINRRVKIDLCVYICIHTPLPTKHVWHRCCTKLFPAKHHSRPETIVSVSCIGKWREIEGTVGRVKIHDVVHYEVES